VSTPILGADFLTHYNLLIDLGNRQLIDTVTQLSTKGEIIAIKHYNISTISNEIPPKYAKLLEQYIEITKPLTRSCINKNGYAHRIITHGPPPTARPRRLAGEKAAAAKQQINELLDAGIIRPSSSKYASPIHLVQKKEGTWR
ncbi:GSCOCG00011181001-RA-CDS, partial [Cotesia congregata]